MAVKFEIKPLSKRIDQDLLHISHHQKGSTVTASISVFKYQDKNTKQFIIYIPSLEISGYGETKEKATLMAQQSVAEYLLSLAKLSQKQVEKELSSLGWKHNKVGNKDYSKSYVDLSGELKDFAVNENVEQELLTA